MKTPSPNPSKKNSRTNSPDAGDHFSPAAKAAEDEWVAVGKVVGVFGIGGEVKVEAFTSFPERFAETPLLYAGAQHTPFKVLRSHPHKHHVLLQLEGTQTVEAAERLRGLTLYIPADQIHALTENQYYLHDVVGLRVLHVDGRELGTVKDILLTGGIDLFVVQSSQTGKEILLPAVKEFIKTVDIPAGVLEVDPIPGLFDDDGETAF
jgi:16S rRNA processing protein RimM